MTDPTHDNRGDTSRGGRGGAAPSKSHRGGKGRARRQSQNNKLEEPISESNEKESSASTSKQAHRGRGGLHGRRPSGGGSSGSKTTTIKQPSTPVRNNNKATENVRRKPQSGSTRASSQKGPPVRNAAAVTHHSGSLSAAEMLAFLEDGVHQVRISPETRESFIKKLAKDAGLITVRQITETELSNTYSIRRPSFIPHCTLFLQLITDETVLNSTVLEISVDTLYNYIYGFDGKRGVPFFQRVSVCLVQLANTPDNNVLEALLFSTKALLAMLTRNQGSTIKTEFSNIIDQFELCCRNIDGKSDRSLRSIEENIAKIKDFLSIGDAIPAFRVEADALDVPRGSKSRRAKEHEKHQDQIDLPGEMSEIGPRHDNDNANISEISTLPTASEILSTRLDYLPIRNSDGSPGKHHQTGILQLFDSQYRLLREDTSGLVRDSLRLILQNWDSFASYDIPWKEKRRLMRNHSPTPVRMYTGAEVRSLTSDKKFGIEMVVEFDQVQRLRRLHPGRREHWWRTSRELRENGPVLALVRQREVGDVDLLFCIVAKREISAAGASDNTQAAKNYDDQGRRIVNGLSDDAERASITLRMASPNRDAGALLRLASTYGTESDSLLLFEFPAVLFRSFDGVLRCLQSIHNNPSSMPFSTWLVPRQNIQALVDQDTAEASERVNDIPPPAYITDAVSLNLDCLAKTEEIDESSNIPRFSLSQDPNVLATQIAESTTLDPGQAVALVSALRHEIALIQGPPGTGKSFVGLQLAKCLLDNRDSLNLGPIVCICYTNHALDQFLNELMDLGISNLIRIGTPSMTARLQALSLDNVKKSKPLPRNKNVGREIKACQATLSNLDVQIKDVCSQIGNTAEMVLRYVEKRDPERIGILVRDDVNRANEVGDRLGRLDSWLAGDGPGRLDGSTEERTIDELLVARLSTLTNAERQYLYQYWQTCAISELRVLLGGIMEAFVRTKQTLTSYFHASDLQVLETAHVLGITTTQFANNSDLLRGLKAKVIICEEAGEVLESHVLTALLPSVQHLVLIGDHLQLRPKISNLTLSKERSREGARYNLDESLFERLAGSRLTANGVVAGDAKDGTILPDGFPVAQLDHQRRMHPSISNLIRQTLYPKLQDHPKTSEYPEVVGLKDRLFWLDHRNFEDATDESEPMQSKTNTWEAEMVTALVRHLCRQGAYKPGEIAVLTPYLGQLRILTEKLAEVAELVINEKDLEDLYDSDKEAETTAGNSGGRNKKNKKQVKVEKGRLLDRIRMATIDNFQGEEATVIIISLVRSNQRKICGFLKASNRINVLLSRAKHGMYIIGNAETAMGDPRTSSHVAMWDKIIGMLEENRSIGDRLALHCARHPENKVFVKSPDDFAVRAPEGGCDAKCKLRLQCGHSCSFKCHPQALHDMVMCREPCTRMKDCGHACRKKCSDSCGECHELIHDVQLSCGHIAEAVECSKMATLDTVKCQKQIQRTFPRCGHNVMLPCWRDISSTFCMKICDELLPCGHSCRKICSSCRRLDPNESNGAQHGACLTPCGRGYTTCSHTCSKPCHPETPCPPCNLPCEVRCRHSFCPKKCQEPCPPCAERCGWTCDHQKEQKEQCQLPCAVPCNIKPCNERCGRKLERCGHACPGVCGERCPSSAFCKECADPESEILEKVVDYINFETYRDINPDEDPLIFLECGHFYTISSLDGIMELEESYKPKERVASGGTAVKTCPECRLPIRNVSRYNRAIKSALLDEATRRFVAYAAAQSAELITEIQERESKIEAERSIFVSEWSGEKSSISDSKLEVEIQKYQWKGFHLLKAIKEYRSFVSKAEQPFGRVNDMLASVIAKKGNTIGGDHQSGLKLDDSMIQTGFQLRAECMRFRAQWPILWDLDTIASNTKVDSRIRKILRQQISTRLKGELKGCKSLLESSEEAKLRQYQIEATIYHALFTILGLSNDKEQGKSISDEGTLREEERKSLEACEEVIAQHPGTMAHLSDDLDRAKRLLNGGTFYTLVTTEERRNIYQAMASQFSGTGHWYYCQNRHPFTVGECGMPMELARCPECGAPVGGSDHTSVQGVQSAADIEAEFGRYISR